MSEHPRGATPQDWWCFDVELGLGANLLPCVQADAEPGQGSKIKTFGKVPSAYDPLGFAYGLKDWQKRELLPNELAQWRKDPRLNICVRTGVISGVAAIDIDIDDRTVAQDIAALVGREFLNCHPPAPVCARGRDNSGKLLIPFILPEGGRKRIIETQHGRIECLLDGQQFVAAGSHSSGSRYRWTPDLPNHLPTVTLEQLNRMWSELTSRFATSPSTAKPTAVVTSGGQASSDTPLSTISDSDWLQLIEALKFLAPHAGDNDLWSEIGISLISIKDCGKPVAQLWMDFSRKAPNFDHESAWNWWKAHTS
jgi:hypothetical protein